MTLPPSFLLLPGPDDRTFPGLARKVRLVALRRLLTLSRGALSGPMAEALPRLQTVLAEVARLHGQSLRQVLGCPDVLAPLLVLEAGLGDAGAMVAEAVPPLLVGLARRNALPEAVLWPGPISRLVDEDTGRVLHFDPPAQMLMAISGGAEVKLADGRLLRLDPLDEAAAIELARHGGRALYPIRNRLQLSLVDTNPLSWVEEHPDKRGNAVDLGGRSPEEWVRALQEALGLLDLGLPGWMGELGISLRRVVPVGYEPERHLSASYREAPGLCYLTLHPDPLTMAEAILHETQHGKLNVLHHLDPVLQNGRTTWTPSPVRPDLRPLMGVMLAVHAFVPVAALHASLVEMGHPLTRTERFEARRREVLAGNTRGLAVLEELARPTPIGRRLMLHLRRLHDILAVRVPDLRVAASALPPG